MPLSRRGCHCFRQGRNSASGNTARARSSLAAIGARPRRWLGFAQVLPAGLLPHSQPWGVGVVQPTGPHRIGSVTWPAVGATASGRTEAVLPGTPHGRHGGNCTSSHRWLERIATFHAGLLLRSPRSGRHKISHGWSGAKRNGTRGFRPEPAPEPPKGAALPCSFCCPLSGSCGALCRVFPGTASGFAGPEATAPA